MVYAVHDNRPLVTRKTIKNVRKMNVHEKKMRKIFASYDRFIIDTDSSGKVTIRGLRDD